MAPSARPVIGTTRLSLRKLRPHSPRCFPGDSGWLSAAAKRLTRASPGDTWPTKAERNARLKECADVIRALWDGQTVDHAGRVTTRNARLYTRPQRPPLLFGAAITEETARWLGQWADGMITVGASHDGLRKTVEAFRAGGGAGKPIYLQTAVCLAATEDEALDQAHLRWRNAALPPNVLGTLETPQQFDAATRNVTPDELRSNLRISSSARALFDSLVRDGELGFDKIFVHHVGEKTPHVIEQFGKLLPAQSP